MASGGKSSQTAMTQKSVFKAQEGGYLEGLRIQEAAVLAMARVKGHRAAGKWVLL